MKPNALHFVVTVEDSITIGRHFYCASTTLLSVIGIVHTFLMDNGITNVVHDNALQSVLRRMMGMWSMRYNEDSYSFDDHHTPDVSTPEGLLNFTMLGCMMEFGRVLDRRTYTERGISKKETAEIIASRQWFRTTQPKIASTSVIFVGNRATNAASIFKRVLVELAASVITYKRELDAPNDALFTERALMDEMEKFFRANYKELLPCFLELVKNEHKFLSWSGDAISITKRTSQDSWDEFFNFTDLKLYEIPLESIPSAIRGSIPEASTRSSILSSIPEEMDVDDSPDTVAGPRLKAAAKPRSHGQPVRSSRRILERATSAGVLNKCNLYLRYFTYF
jgi:hypothetical protein